MVHDEVKELIDGFEALDLPDIADISVDEARKMLADLVPDRALLADIHSVDDRTIAATGGELKLRVYRPSPASGLALLMWFHGGGWVLGDLDAGEYICRDLANRVGCVVAAVDYRLAPETRFPGAFDDCLAATRWVSEHAAELGVDGHRLAVGGDSAGANLAACVAVAAHEAGLHLVHQLLAYPVIEYDPTLPSYRENGEGYLLTARAMQWFWDHYTDPDDRTDPRVAPINGDLRRAPRAWIFTAGHDPLRDEGLHYAAALEAAGVQVDRLHDPGAIHGVFGMPLRCAEAARASAAASLAAAFEVG